jgi:hypothetical protein
MPAPRWLRRSGHVLGAAAAAAALAALFVPAQDPATHGLVADPRPAGEVVALLLAAAVLAATVPRLAQRPATAWLLGVVVGVAALLNLADATVPSLLGRDVNVYWDLRHVGSLVGLARGAAGTARVASAGLLVAVMLALGLFALYRLWRSILRRLADRRIALASAGVLLLMLLGNAVLPAAERPLAANLGRRLAHHISSVQRTLRALSGRNSEAALAAPVPVAGDLAGLKRRDVTLVFIESYGTVVFDRPAFRRTLDGALRRFATTLARAGYRIASDRLVSPTFGGGSWLAHATLASGVRLDDPVRYALLTRSGRPFLPHYLKRAGWRTVNIEPGIRAPFPEGRAWDFDREVYAAQLGYQGRPFGWFVIPDQYTLDRAAALRATLGTAAPVFTQFVLVSSHVPFDPIPPYVADWHDAGSFASIPKAVWPQIYRTPAWTDLAPAYLKSLEYDFAVLGDWLAKRAPTDGLVILLGDHQPPALVAGGGQQWTVPIHVVSRDPDLIAPFLAQGYVRGLVPNQPPPHPGMEEFLGGFLRGFDRTARVGRPAAD